jgi:hypothetical protein
LWIEQIIIAKISKSSSIDKTTSLKRKNKNKKKTMPSSSKSNNMEQNLDKELPV